MPDTPTLSIVIPTFQAGDHLGRTISSLTSQGPPTLDRIEVIGVDGGSTDNTVALAEESGVFNHLSSAPDAGIYDAMNKGAALATGSWIQFLGAGDAYATPSSLATTLDLLAEVPPDRAWATAGAVALGGDGTSATRIPNLPHRWLRHAIGVQPHCHQAVWIRRELFEAGMSHSLDIGIAADFDFIMRLGMVSRPVEFDMVLIEYLGGGVSDGAWAESRRSQHRSRVLRFGLGGPLAAADLVVGWLARSYVRSRVSLGGVRALAHSRRIRSRR